MKEIEIVTKCECDSCGNTLRKNSIAYKYYNLTVCKNCKDTRKNEFIILIGKPRQPIFRGIEQSEIGWIRLDDANLVKEGL